MKSSIVYQYSLGSDNHFPMQFDRLEDEEMEFALVWHPPPPSSSTDQQYTLLGKSNIGLLWNHSKTLKVIE